ncbi:class I SAM-dependent methyltransferase [Nostoc sp. 'Peltigera membranacea cyanobiont' N6]|uniref:class I SAM-dependent methyltransferase n=1 Tax=Nostoc sp. 'Peltigera membranacea cyanobiont' N6 TaxID=1261031 RepID=UPI000CF31364|nr:methyltransferase domain-containing protein [Nostoc sp. 'Peltigera membranacea cyanobiont' N6]AVH63798.1 SAM-dependent methyltransferase [Nostoc sp. 'Peltigera membranacea cyanobiont' N6]
MNVQQHHLEEYEEKKKDWESNWSDVEFSPTWRISKIPPEVQDAVDSGWFSPGALVVDIGCGTGEIASWLAQQGFNVLGIDYSQAAIEKAKSLHGEIQGKLEFKIVDICRQPLTSPGFNCLIDRGCFHIIPQVFSSDYLRTVASWCTPKARFLLLYATNRGSRLEFKSEERLRKEAIAYIKATFTPVFEITEIKTTVIERSPPDELAPALAVWMMPKEDQEESRKTWKQQQVKMGGKQTIRILVKGDRDAIDSLLPITQGAKKLDKSLQDLINEKSDRAFQIEIICEPGGRSDLWLQQLAEIPSLNEWHAFEQLGSFPSKQLETLLTEQSPTSLLAADIDIIVFSTQAEITKNLWQHSQTGYLINILEDWEQQLSEAEKQEFQQHFSPTGLLSVEQSQANFSQLIQLLKEKTGAYIICYNCCDFDPSDRTTNYHNIGETLRLRIQKLNLALLKLSMQEGISLIDVESLLAELGAAQHVTRGLDYSPEAYQVICQEFLRVITDVGFFENRPLLKQIGRRKD